MAWLNKIVYSGGGVQQPQVRIKRRIQAIVHWRTWGRATNAPRPWEGPFYEDIKNLEGSRCIVAKRKWHRNGCFKVEPIENTWGEGGDIQNSTSETSQDEFWNALSNRPSAGMPWVGGLMSGSQTSFRELFPHLCCWGLTTFLSHIFKHFSVYTVIKIIIIWVWNEKWTCCCHFKTGEYSPKTAKYSLKTDPMSLFTAK